MNRKRLLGLVLLVSLLGCNRLTMENYGKVTIGMPYDEVVRLLGKPEKCDDAMGLRSCVWGDETASAHVNFIADKVVLFSSSNLK